MPPPLPDIVSAFIAHTATLPNTSAIVGSRISGRRRSKGEKDPQGWKMPTFGIVYHSVPGPVYFRQGTVPVTSENLQIECYGPNLMESKRLWRTLYTELFPDPPVPQGFHAAHCAVMSIQVIGQGAPAEETDTDFPRTIATILPQYCERPV